MMIYLVSEIEYFYSPAIDRRIKGTTTVPLEAFDNKQDAVLFCGSSSIKKINNLINSGKIKQFIPSFLTEEKENFLKKHNIKDFKVKSELIEEFMKVFEFNFYVVNEVKLHSICG